MLHIGRWAVHGRTLAQFLRMNTTSDNKVTVVYDLPGVSERMLSRALKFWAVSDANVTFIPISDDLHGIADSDEEYVLMKSSYDSPLASYKVGSEEYAIYSLQNLPPPTVEDFGPRSTGAGIGFNTQSDGTSAVWIRASQVSSSTVVMLDDVQLKTTLGENGAVSAIVPAELFAEPGTHEIYLYDRISGKRSSSRTFEVKDIPAPTQERDSTK